MKAKLFYIMLILISFSCGPGVIAPAKLKKVAVHTFTGKGTHNEIINWFYIRDILERGSGGYYLESTSEVNDFKQANFIYSKIRPPQFEGQAASNEKVQFLNLDDLPDDLLKHSSSLESSYK
jgi:hypothetical protein